MFIKKTEKKEMFNKKVEFIINNIVNDIERGNFKVAKQELKQLEAIIKR